jgi:hypothetical protein
VRSFLLGLSVALASVGCNGGVETADAGDAGAEGGNPFFDAAPLVDPFGDASLALRTRALFAQTCGGGPESGCHTDHAAGWGAVLDPDGGDTVNVASTEIPSMLRVEPGHPERSYVYWKVSADPRIDGGVMPLSTGYDPRIPALIGPWIEAGAP